MISAAAGEIVLPTSTLPIFRPMHGRTRFRQHERPSSSVPLLRSISSCKVPDATRGGSAGRSLPLKENHYLRGADGPNTRHREAADDPPALGRVAVERVLQVLWTELAGPPAVFLRQHLVFHGLSTSLKRPANAISTVPPPGHACAGSSPT